MADLVQRRDSGDTLLVKPGGVIDVQLGGALRVNGQEVTGGGGGATTLATLTDVDLTGVVAGDALEWDGSKLVKATGEFVKKATAHLTTADLRVLGTTTFEVIPAPGANKVINIIRSFARSRAGAHAFPSTALLSLGTQPYDNPALTLEASFFAAVDTIAAFETAAPNPFLLADMVNQPVALLASGDMTQAPIDTVVINAGGRGYQVGDTLDVQVDSSDAVVTVAAVTPYSGAITAVDVGAQTFTVLGDQTAHFAAQLSIAVTGSTGNDNPSYTCNGDPVFDSTSTTVTVYDVIASPIADGTLSSDAGPITSLTVTDPGTIYGLSTGVPLGNDSALGADATADVTVLAPAGDGSLDVTVDYKVVDVT